MPTRNIQMPDGTIVTGVPDEFAQFGEELNPVLAGLLSSRQFILDRLPDSIKVGPLRELPQGALSAVQEQQPVASGVGEAFFPVAAGLAAPGRVVAQAAVAGGLEALDKNATAGSVATQAGLAGGGQAVGNMATRVISGISRGVSAMRGGPALRTTSPTLRIVSETGLGRGRVEAINQTSLLRRLGQVFGIDDMKSLGPAQLAGAADNIGGQFDEALKITQPIDLTDVNTALRELPPSNFPGRKAILQQVDNLHATDNSKALRGLHRALRDKAAVMKRNPVLAGFDDQLDNAVGLLDDAATRAGADTGKLREAGQRWKVLKTIEETPEAWIDGRINPRQLATKFGRENVKGFGTALKRGKTDKLAQPVQGFLDDVMNLADDVRVVGRSGTPEGLVAGGGAIAGGAGLMSGAIDPATAGAGLVAYGLIPPLAGAASVGEAAPLVGKALAASRVLADDE